MAELVCWWECESPTRRQLTIACEEDHKGHWAGINGDNQSIVLGSEGLQNQGGMLL